ncbi:MAG: cell wall hydrolase [Butyrivibrio sp.]|nr:cell wall hydrolase [Butyrivibrio sp.]
MGFKGRKAALLAVLAMLLLVQAVFSGMNTSDSGNVIAADAGADMTEPASETVPDDKAAESTEAKEPQTEENTVPFTNEEVVSADLNVVYRSTLTLTEAVDKFDGSIEKGDYDNKIVSYTSERLCIYAEPEFTSEVLGVMYSGSEGEVVEAGKEWSKITSGGITGYVRNVNVLFGKEAEVIASTLGHKTTTVVEGGAAVYDEASRSSRQNGTLDEGSAVEVLDSVNGFFMVSYNGGFGYVLPEAVIVNYGLDTAISIEVEKQRQEEEAAAAAAAAAKKAAEEAAAAAAAAKQNSSVTTGSIRGAYAATEEEIHLLAAIVYWESGWEPAEGQLAVANVVLNRVLSSRFSQNTIASVIYAPGQFTGVAENGAPSARFQQVLNMSNEQLNARGCYDAALKALSGQNNIEDYAFFISVKKANYGRYTKYTIINNHCFYMF